jgi:hypothetical protein
LNRISHLPALLISKSWLQVRPGLPDGMFSDQKSQIVYILESLGLENVGTYTYIMVIWYILWPFGIFYGHLVYFMAIWNILWPFGTFLWTFGKYVGILWPFLNFVVIWYIFPRFGIFYQEKSGNPGYDRQRLQNSDKNLVAACDHTFCPDGYLILLIRIATRVHMLQGCQIFLDTVYQNGEKYTKLL